MMDVIQRVILPTTYSIPILPEFSTQTGHWFQSKSAKPDAGSHDWSNLILNSYQALRWYASLGAGQVSNR